MLLDFPLLKYWRAPIWHHLLLESDPGPDWPHIGNITIDNLQMRYRAGLELVSRHNTPVMLEVAARRAARMARRQADHTPEPSDEEEEGVYVCRQALH